jgi:nucleoside-diphosphate-sugar epimerase
MARRILILGGGWFLGRTLAEHAVARGWQVTTFTRGRSGDLAPGVDAVYGDRYSDSDLARLAKAGPWDAVVDTSGHEPVTVAAAARILEPHTQRYVYMSTVNVYAGWPDEPLADESELLPATSGMRAETDAAARGVGGAAAYGVLKAGCEHAVIESFGMDRSLILRPGVLLGPREYVGRLPWLLQRMARGGQVLAAGPASQTIQPLDVRDLADFVIHGIERGLSGAMNTTAPAGHATYGQLLALCNQTAVGGAELVWVDPDWLSQQDVRQWTEIPLWRTADGAWRVSSRLAEAAGLRARPMADTIVDTWAWLQSEYLMPHPRQDEIGLDQAKEAGLLAAWLGQRV